MPWDFWLIFLFLGVVVPWRGHVRLQRLLARPCTDPKERIVLYGATIVFQWTAALVVAWRALARGLTPAQLGLASHLTTRIFLASLVGAVVIGTLHWLNLKRIAKMEAPAADLIKRLAARILPHSLVELLPYCALAITAGICEEFLYRGFAMGTFARVGLPTWIVVLLSSLLFGLAHAYQGKTGIVSTALLGILFAVTRLAYDSLIPVIVWHSVVDVIAGIAGPKYMPRDTVAE